LKTQVYTNWSWSREYLPMRNIVASSLPCHSTSRSPRNRRSIPMHSSWIRRSMGLQDTIGLSILGWKWAMIFAIRQRTITLLLPFVTRTSSFSNLYCELWGDTSNKISKVVGTNTYSCAILIHVAVIVQIHANFFFDTVTANHRAVAGVTIQLVC